MHNLSLEGQLGRYDLSPEAAVRVTPVVTAGLRASGLVLVCGRVALLGTLDPMYNARHVRRLQGVSPGRALVFVRSGALT